MNVVLLLIRRDEWTAQEIPFLTYHICFVVYSGSARKLSPALSLSQTISGIDSGVNYYDLGVVTWGWMGHNSPRAEKPQ